MIIYERIRRRFRNVLNGRTSIHQNVGKATCKSVSTVDYFLSSPNLFEKIEHFQVHNFCEIISDAHCLVSLNFSFQHARLQAHSENATEQICRRDSSKIDSFKANINLEEIRSINENILKCMSSSQASQKEIDDIVNKINTSLLSHAESSFGKVKLKDSQMHETPKWFGPKCSNTRKNFTGQDIIIN